MSTLPERDWKKESQTFDTVAEDYDTYRPRYPAALVKSIVNVCGIGAGSRLLEIGSGSGIGTRPFAEMGCSVLCIEPGANLAAVAARRLKDYPGVSFAITRFEDWTGEEKGFDLVFSAQAFHWVPPGGFAKVAAALKEGGWLALFWNLPPDSELEMFEEMQVAYRAYAPQFAGPRPSTEETIQQRAQAICDSGYFSLPETRRFAWSTSYTTAEYVGLLNTYSDHISLPPNSRQRLYAAVAEIIDRHGGRVEKPYLAALFTAQKL